MKDRKRMAGRFVVWTVVALVLMVELAALAWPAQAASETNLTVRGTFVFKFFTKGGWQKSCVSNPDGSITCTIDASGAFYGGVTGRFTTHISAIGTPVPGAPFIPTTAAATMTCDPCSVAGHSGSVLFDSPYTVSSQGFLTGRLTVLSAGGGLAGLTGTGTYIGTSPDAADPYVLGLTLPT